MDPRKHQFLTAIVGNDGAQALAKAVERIAELELAILPRAILAWLEVMGPMGYDGEVPGVGNAFSFNKSEDGYSGHIVLDGESHVFQNASLYHLAGCMAVALGLDHERISPLAKSEQLVKLGKGIDLLVKSRVVQAMAKTSWNVKQKRSNLTPQQASGRRVRYAQSIGLNPEPIPTGQFGTPVPTGNTIPYRPSSPVEHEAAHAMMTPPGQNMGGYIKDLSTTDSGSVPASIRSAARPSKNPNYNDPARVQAAQSGEAFQRHAMGQQEENIATQMEHGIDRRSGVKGQTWNSRAARSLFNGSPHDTIPGYEVDQVVPGSPSRSEKLIPSPMIRAKAKEHQAKFDDGASFDAAGNVMGPRGIDARINARAKLGKKIDPLVKPRVVQEMAKTSMNVKQRRLFQFSHGQDQPDLYANRKPIPLSDSQVNTRREQYARTLGLNPSFGVKEGDSSGGFPNASQGNDLSYNKTFDAAHEMGHAVMTPEDDTLGQYQKWLSDPARTKAPGSNGDGDDDDGDGNEDAVMDYDEGLHHENLANAAEMHIDRRAGVDPHAFQSAYRTNMQSAYEEPEGMYHPKSGDVVSNPSTKLNKLPRNVDGGDRKAPIPADHIRQEASNAVKAFDGGKRFGPDGRVKLPGGINNVINQRAETKVPAIPTMKKAALPSGGGNKAKLPGVAAQPIAPSLPTPPTPEQPTNQKQMPQGAAGMSTASPLPQVKTGTKPKTSMKVTKSQAGVKCPACNRPQFVQSQFKGCFCMAALAKSVKTIETNEGFTLTFGSDWDRDAIETLFETFQGE